MRTPREAYALSNLWLSNSALRANFMNDSQNISNQNLVQKSRPKFGYQNLVKKIIPKLSCNVRAMFFVGAVHYFRKIFRCAAGFKKRRRSGDVFWNTTLPLPTTGSNRLRGAGFCGWSIFIVASCGRTTIKIDQTKFLSKKVDQIFVLKKATKI